MVSELENADLEHLKVKNSFRGSYCRGLQQEMGALEVVTREDVHVMTAFEASNPFSQGLGIDELEMYQLNGDS